MFEVQYCFGPGTTFGGQAPMSALPPRADIGTQPCDVCFVPKADIVHCAVQQIQTYSITSSARAAHLVSRTELLPVTCFEFFISGLTSNAWPNPRTWSSPSAVRRNNVKSCSGRIMSNTFPNFLLKSDITVRHSVVSLPTTSTLHWQEKRFRAKSFSSALRLRLT